MAPRVWCGGEYRSWFWSWSVPHTHTQLAKTASILPFAGELALRGWGFLVAPFSGISPRVLGGRGGQGLEPPGPDCQDLLQATSSGSSPRRAQPITATYICPGA